MAWPNPASAGRDQAGQRLARSRPFPRSPMPARSSSPPLTTPTSASSPQHPPAPTWSWRTWSELTCRGPSRRPVSATCLQKKTWKWLFFPLFPFAACCFLNRKPGPWEFHLLLGRLLAVGALPLRGSAVPHWAGGGGLGGHPHRGLVLPKGSAGVWAPRGHGKVREDTEIPPALCHTAFGGGYPHPYCSWGSPSISSHPTSSPKASLEPHHPLRASFYPLRVKSPPVPRT